MTVRPTAASWAATILVTASLAACLNNPPHADGKPSAPPSPSQFWTPPKRAVTHDVLPKNTIPPDIAERVAKLTLPDVLDIGLLNNPETRASYATARSAGATIGAAYGHYLPQVSVAATAERVGSSSSGVSASTSSGTVIGGGNWHSLIQPNATASWLLFDFSRSSSIEYAKEDAYAASFTHNATVQTVVLTIEQAYFNYNSAKAVRDGDLESIREDSTNLVATQERHNAGVSTISDVLQAQSTLSAEELTLETDEGTVQTTRGALAVAMGFPANLPYDITPEPPNVPIAGIADSIQELVEVAVNKRPDLLSYRAQARQAHANIGIIRGEALPSLSLGGGFTRSFSFFSGTPSQIDANTYTATAGVSWPIFSGFSSSYNILQAKEAAKASDANAEYQRDQVVYQVFTSYYNLRTATARVKSANDLLTASQQSYDVAIGQYKQGVGSILTVLTAQATLASARSQQASARWTWYSDLAQLSHDIGTLGLHGESDIRLTSDSSRTPPPPR
jgi:outer membrane protein